MFKFILFTSHTSTTSFLKHIYVRFSGTHYSGHVQFGLEWSMKLSLNINSEKVFNIVDMQKKERRIYIQHIYKYDTIFYPWSSCNCLKKNKRAKYLKKQSRFESEQTVKVCSERRSNVKTNKSDEFPSVASESEDCQLR